MIKLKIKLVPRSQPPEDFRRLAEATEDLKKVFREEFFRLIYLPIVNWLAAKLKK